MNTFSQSSRLKLSTCDSELIRLAMEVLKIHDCTVLTGFRSEDAQNKLLGEGRSKLTYPFSKHNKMPSQAIDLAPYPIDWEDEKRFYYFAGIVRGVAHSLGIRIRWGGDWDSDNDLNDQSFDDLVHFELQ
jgi:peptidoglycan L-alanyl-D-glutamate endopeptidase CwlK